MRLLLVEDDTMIGEVVLDLLRAEHYAVDWVKDGEMADTALRQNQNYDLVLLDLGLPRKDGLDVLRALRARKDRTPVLVATARDAVAQRIAGLDAGADDYVLKPYDLDELLARIRALLRRTQMERAPVITFADLTLDTSTRQATRKGRVISLTAKEYDLLELFLRHPRQVLTREMIFDRVWGYDFGGESNVLDVYIRYLRQKLEIDGEARLIHTVRGVGYVLRETP